MSDQLGEMEEWRPIPGFDGYEVSSHGNVRSWLVQGSHRIGARLAAPRPCRDGHHYRGYRTVTLSNRGARRTHRFIHALVLTAFVGPCPTGMECRHIDGDKTNNHLGNLAWGTGVENYADQVRHGVAAVGSRAGLAKLTEAKVFEIRRLLSFGVLQKQLAQEFGVGIATIGSIARGKTWRHVVNS